MKISEKKRQKIAEQVLALLYEKAPQAMFTAHIAQEIARDEEFVKSLLEELKSKNLVTSIKKNPEGFNYSRRIRWKLSDKAYETYRQLQG